MHSVELGPVERIADASKAKQPARHQGRVDEETLRDLVEKHFRYTGSFRAREILA